MKKKQRGSHNRKIFQQKKGQELIEILSSDEDTKEFQEQEENQQNYSIIEWKKLQDERFKQMTGNNLIVSSKQQDLNSIPPKSCLKKMKKDIFIQCDELFGKICDDHLQTVISSEKLQLNQQQIKQCFIVTEFNNIMNDDDDEISITLDELDDLICQRNNDQKKNKNFDIDEFDNIQKRVALNQQIKFDHNELIKNQ